jgi:cytochrome o ubiquinol oxidase subunit 3
MSHEHYPDTHHDPYSKTLFGFWLFLLTDFILFGTLFAVYAVLKDSTFGGPTAQQLLSRSYAFGESFLLLTASFTSGLAAAYAHRENKKLTILYFLVTFIIGLSVFWMQMHEFHQIMIQGYTWKTSAFLSAYFSLIGTVAVHILFGLLWIPVILFSVWKEGVNLVNLRRIMCLKMFWQFINIVWIVIFTIVYLMGVD